MPSVEQKFYSLAAQQCKWTCEYCLNVARSDEAEPVLINLSKFFREKKTYVLPDHFKGAGHEERLIDLLKGAASKSGFKLIKRDTDRRGKKFDVVMRFCCRYGTPYVEDKNRDNTTPARRTSTTKPISKEHQCLFGFTLKKHRQHLGTDSGRWEILRGNSNSVDHRGHAQIRPNQLSVSTKNLTRTPRLTGSASTAINKEKEVTEILREILKNMGNDEELYVKFLADLNALADKYGKNMERTKTKTKGSCENNDPDAHKGKEVTLEMVPTGKATQKNEKRKKGYCEQTSKRKK